MRALAIDFGRKRIGLALSDATGMLARPWKTLAARGGLQQTTTDVLGEIEALRNESDGLAAIVIGWPRRLSGEPTEETRRVEAFTGQLRMRVDVPVVLQDERLTSREAERLLAQREKDWRKRKPLLDAAAAAVILQDYLDSQFARGDGVERGGAEPPTLRQAQGRPEPCRRTNAREWGWGPASDE